MNIWTCAVALAMVGALVAGPAVAQTSGGDTTAPKADQSVKDQVKSDVKAQKEEMKSDMKEAKEKAKAKKDDIKADMKDMKASMKGGKNREHVRAAQQALKDKGHDPGAVDGRMGPKTMAALRDFQKKEGLKETGRLDSDTMAKLGTSPAASPATDTTSPAAPKAEKKQAP